MKNILLDTELSNLKLFKKGKVRDIYDLGEYFLIVVSDRISAFDVIMEQGIPSKGEVLNKISAFWFKFTEDIIDNHVISVNVDEYPAECRQYSELLKGRSMLVKKAEVLPVECIVRGYISGSGWSDYQRDGKISGIELPEGLVESEKLPEVIFTPSTKAEIGTHDENITQERAREIIGAERFEEIKKAAIAIYKKAAEYALSKDIIIADTKMEFGVMNGKLIIVDELLTPDSSRFWDKAQYEKGKAQASYDKQYLRDYLLSINFNKQPPAPVLPDEVIINTAKKYQEALYKLSGEKIEE